MQSPFQIRAATEADINRIVDIQFSAFAGDPYQDALFPGDPDAPSVRQGAIARTQQFWTADPTARWVIAVDSAAGTIPAFALWNVYAEPRPDAASRHPPPEVDWCTGRQQEIARNFLAMNQRVRERVWGGRPYVLLNLLCVHAECQRRGAGTRLVEWGMALADDLGLPIHIEASAAGYQLYRKLGFEQVDVEYVRAEEWDGDHDREYIAMVRKPGISKGDPTTSDETVAAGS